MTLLREIRRTDLPVLNAWRNDPGLVACLGAPFLYISPEIDEKWFNSYLGARDTNVRLAILPDIGAEPVGLVNLTGINRIHRHAEFSIMIGDREHRSRGHGEAAIRQILKHGFNDLNLNRIFLHVLEANERARRLYDKIGFVYEGTQKEALYKDGAYHSLVLMALLKSQYQGEIVVN